MGASAQGGNNDTSSNLLPGQSRRSLVAWDFTHPWFIIPTRTHPRGSLGADMRIFEAPPAHFVNCETS